MFLSLYRDMIIINSSSGNIQIFNNNINDDDKNEINWMTLGRIILHLKMWRSKDGGLSG